MEKPDAAVRLRHACKSYGKGPSLKTVLSNLNMDVPKGSIYGLLGASGCGKTTILGCIAGRLKLDSGELHVLGGVPGAEGSGIPGSRIGYMPQEPALISYMTIKNVLYYFGWIFGMSNLEIAERHEFLLTLLDLPNDDRCIRKLSGGQQRRVSLAAALVQTPELLLLDEPTVGLDPILRQTIWDYMTGIARDQGITIIITTHYIEEATQAHKIGLLRDGILLADASPQQIMQDYSCDSLEEAFLQLSTLQEVIRTDSQIQPSTGAAFKATTSTAVAGNGHNEGSAEVVFNDNEISFNENNLKTFARRKSATWRNHIKALLYKDVLTIRRNYIGLLSAVLLPLVALVIIFIALGQDGYDMPLGIVNDESANCTEIIRVDRNFTGAQRYLSGEDYDCHFQELSCVYINLLEESITVRLHHYNDLETAVAASRATINQALIYIPSNFSAVLEKRATKITVDSDTIDANLLLAQIDMSDYIIGHQLKKFMIDKFTELMEIVSRACNVNKKSYLTPVTFLEPVYGHHIQSQIGSSMPGIIIIMVHVFASTVSSTLISTDRANGIWDRNLLTVRELQYGMAESEIAVLFRNAYKSYGSGTAAKSVLVNLNMCVPRGSIYGLLGASGCGKTTIMGCIAARLKLDSGEVKVLGEVPGTKESGIPGPRIGYMPQELALVGDMTIKNILYYFGWMFGMCSEDISERIEFLSKLLELPVGDRLIKTLSGGQQRRVSLAVALIQTPELLLLDEPTVGLDPVLRQSIWDHLVKLSSEQEITIIITTHYIEEATQANKIGLLREGLLLADSAPDVLITKYNCTTLEEAFLLLSEKQGANQTNNQQPITETGNQSSCPGNDSPDLFSEEDGVVYKNGKIVLDRRVNDNWKSKKARKRTVLVVSAASRMKALMYKDLLSVRRNHMGTMFMFVIPILLISIFFVVTANEGRDLPLGVVNDEFPNCSDVTEDARNYSGVMDDIRNYSGVMLYGDRDCHYHALSCVFIEKLEASTTVRLIHFENQESARAASIKTANQAYLYFPSNFSKMLLKRHKNPRLNDTVMIEQSEIKAWIDMSDYVIGYQLKKFLLEKYFELTAVIADGCKVNRKLLLLPLQIQDPVYGSKDQSYLETTAPGIIIVIVHGFTSTITATVLSAERFSGLWDRNRVAGIYVSAIAKSSMEAIFFASATLFPYAILSGVLWPIPALPRVLQYIGYSTPVTLSAVGFANIIVKGFGLCSVVVLPGLLVPILWIVLFYCYSVFKLRNS